MTIGSSWPVRESSLQTNLTVFPDRVISWILKLNASAKKAAVRVMVLKDVIAAYFSAELDCFRQSCRSSALLLRVEGGSIIL